MTLRMTVAAPFKDKGRDRLPESAFVVALSLDRDWFSADQAKRLVDVAVGEGHLVRTDDELEITFDPHEIAIPPTFRPEEAILRERSTFERVLEKTVDGGTDKQAAVAAINRRQARLAVTIETAAILYAHEQGIDVSRETERTLEELR